MADGSTPAAIRPPRRYMDRALDQYGKLEMEALEPLAQEPQRRAEEESGDND